ncbi:MAG: hypothetical protein CMM52_02455 [Rhodospirillaceae bacterium]|nr:hypothetical protein [Rhodospirillaceae bacterium]|tara:strand:- start:34288 stop:34527 length:240 start_codon:yes stop_codon:yes gene_type:complete
MSEKENAQWTKEEYLAHLVEERERHMAELKIRDPEMYRAIVEGRDASSILSGRIRRYSRPDEILRFLNDFVVRLRNILR